MESALASTGPRLIEYPSDLSGCSFLSYGGKRLLYLCSHEAGSEPFVVILGFLLGQKQDVVTKDLIEPVASDQKRQIGQVVLRLVSEEYANAHIMFL